MCSAILDRAPHLIVCLSGGAATISFMLCIARFTAAIKRNTQQTTSRLAMLFLHSVSLSMADVISIRQLDLACLLKSLAAGSGEGVVGLISCFGHGLVGATVASDTISA